VYKLTYEIVNGMALALHDHVLCYGGSRPKHFSSNYFI